MLNTGAVVLAAGSAREGGNRIADIDKVADLLPIAEDLNGLAAGESIGEKRNNTRVGRPRILARTVQIEEAQSDRRDAIQRTGNTRVKLASAFVGGVGAQRRNRALFPIATTAQSP